MHYLSNMHQFVQMSKCQSTQLGFSCGVPQGSVLVPKLFILYRNYICTVWQIPKCVLFSDDTNTLYCRENLQQLLEVVTKEISKLKTWFDLNQLLLNLNKIKLMWFRHCKINTQKVMIIHYVEIEYELMIVDHKICWKPNRKHASEKAASGLQLLGKVSHILNDKVMYTCIVHWYYYIWIIV